MGKAVIRCSDLGKCFRMLPRENYKALRDSIAGLASAPLRMLRRRNRTAHGNGAQQSLWALREVSFEVERGEILGVIGHNGAGKSTLLKILSRITEPTCGFVEIQGRTGSLLEVGTGFHQELTGRENIFLNGALLGMRRREIERHFDEIVEFAGLPRFIDSPVKQYSSGMYMRLAFAVAAHLDTDVLLVDEVLAVGDIEFQQKCLGKMDRAASEGRTILLVSHNIAAIRYFCDRCMMLERGRIAAIGPTDEVVDRYLSVFQAGSGADLRTAPRRQGDGSIRAVHARIDNPGGDDATALAFGAPLSVTVEFEAAKEVASASVFVLIRNLEGVYLLSPHLDDSGAPLNTRQGERLQVGVRIPNPGLLPGRYLVDVGILNRESSILDWVESAVGFSVVPEHRIRPRCGNVSPPAQWTVGRSAMSCGFPP